MTWIVFFSQTGSEIVRLTQVLGKKPDLIVTNNFDTETHHPQLRMGVTIMSSSHDNLMNYFRNQIVYETSTCLITLHGYLRIIPSDICSKYEIYNGHPANIEDYPNLKGKDPQERTWNEREKYHTIGSVVHRCTEELDGGEIVSRHYVSNRCQTKDEMYARLQECSLHAWEIFLKEKLCA